MNEQEKDPMPQHTKDDSSDIERVREDRAQLQKEQATAPVSREGTPPPEPGKTKEDEEAEKGHS